MSRVSHLDWIPPDSPADQSIQMRPANRDWDAIRVPVCHAQATIDALGSDCGAVLWDTWGGCVYWLVPVGTAATWDLPGTRACGAAQHVAIPSLSHRSRPGLHWLIPPSRERCLTDPELLRGAVRAAVEAAFGPRRVS